MTRALQAVVPLAMLATLWLSAGAGVSEAATFAAQTSYAAGDSPVSVATADLNHDGNKDLATANFSSDNVSVLLGSPAGTFTAATGSPVAAGDSPRSVAIADLNKDGDKDLAV